jgi:hypothetical protein
MFTKLPSTENTRLVGFEEFGEAKGKNGVVGGRSLLNVLGNNGEFASDADPAR